MIIGSLFVGDASRDPLAAMFGAPLTGKRCIGIATGGGEDPGLNALIRALRKLILKTPWKVTAIPDGFDGLIWPEKSFELTLDRGSRILPRGKTILGTTNRGHPFKYESEENGREVVGGVREAHRLATALEERPPVELGRPAEVITHLESLEDHEHVHSTGHVTDRPE
jgi:hypothetical protein